MPGDAPTMAASSSPPSFGRQMAQLVVIPAVIALSCVVVALLFTYLTGRPDTIETQLLQLRQSSGLGRLPMGLQDPRYKDRGRAAASLAQSLRTITQPQRRTTVSAALSDILAHHIGEQEHTLRAYLLLALAQLGQPDTLAVIVEHLDHPSPNVAIAAVQALLEYPDRGAAAETIPALRRAATRPDANLRSVTAAALGAMADPDDAATRAVLRDVLANTDGAAREARWNAAAALARLGDEQGAQVVAQLLLSRQALAQTGSGGPNAVTPQEQTRIILATLATLATSLRLPDADVWASVEHLAGADPDLSVRKRARQLLDAHDADAAGAMRQGG